MGISNNLIPISLIYEGKMQKTIKYKSGKKNLDVFTTKELIFKLWDDKNKQFILPQKIDLKSNKHIIVNGVNLKDKFGFQIYEGDFIRLYWHHQDEEEPIYKVKLVYWDESHQGFQPFIDFCTKLCNLIDYTSIEVIGNIFENPEIYELI